MTRPLDGLRVLELAGGVAGPYAGRLFAMLGADVVKVEPDGGDVARSLQVDDRPLRAHSPLFVHLNAGKKNVARESVDIVDAVRWADIVLHDGVRAELVDSPLDPDALQAHVDGADGSLVLASVTAWGFEAGERGHPSDELLVQAASGLMTATGEDGRGPLRFPGWQSQYLAGGYAAAAALAMLGTPGFHHVDASWVGAALTAVEGGVCAALYQATAWRDPAAEARDRQAGFQTGAFPSGAFRCADGHVIPGTVRGVDWTLQCKVYGRPDLERDERFTARNRWQNREELRRELEPWYDTHTKREIFLAALEVGWAAGMVMTAGDALEDEHLVERKFLTTVAGSRAVIPGRPWRAPGLEPVEAPVLRPLGADDPPFDEARASAVPTPPSVSSLKVVELTWAWAGPFVGRFLGALGADVVRVETGRYPDGWRTRLRWRDVGAPVPEGVDPGSYTWDGAALFNSLNRNKRGVSVDLGDDDGRAIFLRLLESADALVLNMTYHVLADRGVEDEVRAAVDRGLVVLNMPALGATGPYRDMPGYGMLMEGMGGFSARFGYCDEGARASTTYYPDCVAGLHGTIAVLSSLASRSRTGKGAYIDLSQQEVTWLQLGEGLVVQSVEDREPDRLGNAEPAVAPSGIYPCEDGFVALAARGDAQFKALVGVIGDALQLVADIDAIARIARRDEIDAAIRSWTSKRSAVDISSRLVEAGVPAQVVQTHASAYRSGVFEARSLVEHIEHPVTGNRAYLQLPVRVDGRPLASTRAAPVFAQHTDEVLREWADIDNARITELRARDVIGTRPAQPPPRR